MTVRRSARSISLALETRARARDDGVANRGATAARADARGRRASRRRRPRGAKGRTDARGTVAPNLREDVAVTFVVDRALDERAGERGVRACGTAEGVGAVGRAGDEGAVADGRAGDRNRHACTVRCALEEEIIFKLVTVDEDGEVVRWSDGAGVRFTPPKRCASAEVRCEWPSDDARFQVSISMTTDASAE